MCNKKHPLNDEGIYVQKLKARIEKLERDIRILDGIIGGDIHSALRNAYKNDRDRLDEELLELKSELAMFDHIPLYESCSLNDNKGVDDNLRDRIQKIEKEIEDINRKIESAHPWNYYSYKKNREKLETELLELKGELVEKIDNVEREIISLGGYIRWTSPSPERDKYKERLKEKETELLELKGELAEIDNNDGHALNDDGDTYKAETKILTNKIENQLKNGNWEERASDMYTVKTETTTTDHPLNTCEHQFVDVFDYKEESVYGESITITKKYILSYCKVCGYTINGTCTECI